jgi:hypothetical protein
MQFKTPKALPILPTPVCTSSETHNPPAFLTFLIASCKKSVRAMLLHPPQNNRFEDKIRQLFCFAAEFHQLIVALPEHVTQIFASKL